MIFNLYYDFLLKNLWWIALISSLLIIGIWFLTDYLIKAKKKKKSGLPAEKNTAEYLEALGGIDNIIDKKLDKSRIVLKLKDYGLVKKEVLKNAGVTGFILMSDKITLVVKEGAEELYKSIFGE